jgi:hypothetical protein
VITRLLGLTSPQPADPSARLREIILAIITVGGALCLAAWPLWPPGLPLGADTVTHLYTLIHLDDLLRSGEVFSRWLPWQNGGLGNPRFLYYPILPFYLAEIWVLAGASFDMAMRLASGLALFAAASGTYRWCRLHFDRLAAALGASAYVLSPYLLFAAYARASFAELTALGLAPWALWAVSLCLKQGGGWLPATAALFGLTILCHPITGALLLGCGLLLVCSGGFGRPRRLAAVVGLLLSIGLSAVLWLPAALERAAISDAHTHSPGLDYRGAFLPLDTLLSFADDRLLAGYAPAAVLLALLAISAALWRRQAGPMVGWCIGWVALSVAVLPWARPLWDALAPIARDVQFPHRLLGPGSLLLAALVAAGVEVLGRLLSMQEPAGRRRRWTARSAHALAILAAAIGLASSTLPLRHHARLAKLPPLSLEFVVAKERQSGFLGMGYQGEFLPKGVDSLSAAWRASGRSGERLVLSSLPEGARVLHSLYEPLRYEVVVDSPGAWTAVWGTLAFPGWQVATGSQPLATGTNAAGLLTSDIPAGTQRIVVRFGTTPARLAGGWISTLSLLTLLAIAFARRWRRAATDIARHFASTADSTHFRQG